MVNSTHLEPRALCITPRREIELSLSEHDRLRELAKEETRHRYALGPLLKQGTSPFPTLLLADNSQIALRNMGGRGFDYRLMFLASPGDTLVLGAMACPAFEQYCARLLQLKEVRVVRPARGDAFDPIASRLARDQHLLERICETARRSGGLNVRPYSGTQAVWDLGLEITRLTSLPVTVEAPPARLSRDANDKSWFAERVRKVLGEEAVPASRPAHSVPQLADAVTELAQRGDKICLKLPDSAGSLGNLVIHSSEFQGLKGRELCAHLLSRLEAATWEAPFPLQVEVWERNVVSSPSLQVWIPLSGPPLLEGVFDQSLAEEVGRFQGASVSSLGGELLERLSEQASRLACFLQNLGYYGRCSLDSVVTENGQIYWIECNGRWGGTSIPMTVLNRLGIDWNRDKAAIVCSHVHRAPCDFAEVLKKTGDLSWKDRRGVVWLSPTRTEAGEGLDFLAVADSSQKVDELTRGVHRRLE